MELLNLSLAVSLPIACLAFFIFSVTYAVEPWLEAWKQRNSVKNAQWKQDVEERIKKLEYERKN